MKTPYQLRKEKLDERIVAHYHKLLLRPGAMKTACQAATMKKFGIASDETLRAICKRVEQRANQQAVC